MTHLPTLAAGYVTPDVVKAWQDFWPILVVVAAGVLWSVRRLRKWKSDLITEIRSATKPIQPTSNGGLSLPDLHGKVDTALETLDELQRAQTATATALLQHVTDHPAGTAHSPEA